MFMDIKYPVGNRHLNCLELPLTKSYEKFKRILDFTIRSTVRLETVSLCSGFWKLNDGRLQDNCWLLLDNLHFFSHKFTTWPWKWIDFILCILNLISKWWANKILKHCLHLYFFLKKTLEFILSLLLFNKNQQVMTSYYNYLNIWSCLILSRAISLPKSVLCTLTDSNLPGLKQRSSISPSTWSSICQELSLGPCACTVFSIYITSNWEPKLLTNIFL